MTEKMSDELEITYMSLCASIIHYHNGIEYEEKVEEENLESGMVAEVERKKNL